MLETKQKPFKLTVNYHNKLQVIEFSVESAETGAAMGAFKMHLGDFLRTLALTDDDCLSVLQNSKMREPEERPIQTMDLRQIDALSADMTGKTVLDIGGYDGYVSAACLERGAKRAVVVDNQQNRRYSLSDYPFGWAFPLKYAGVEYVLGDLMDFSTWMDYTHLGDVVLCLNVIYHLADPFGALQRLRLLTKGELYISSGTIDDPEPNWRWTYDETRQFFYTPSRSALEAGLRAVGFTSVELLFAGADREVMYRCK